MNTLTISSDEYDAFHRFLEQTAGIVLGDNKHYLLTSRLTRLMSEQRLSSITELLARAESDHRFRERVIDEMTTNETSWFRDSLPFETLKQTILPDLAKKQAKTLRVWSAACASGQEPYSISMCVQEFATVNPGMLRSDVEIIATDISPTALDEAKAGQYEESTLARGLSVERRKRFFKQAGAKWEIRKEIKDRVSFRPFNLSQNFAMLGKFDIIFCRNVLIYFSAETKRDVLQRMANTLVPGGYLVLGGSESMVNYCDAYQMLRVGNAVIYQLKPR